MLHIFFCFNESIKYSLLYATLFLIEHVYYYDYYL